MRGLDASHIGAATAVAAGIVGSAAFIKPTVLSFTGNNLMLTGGVVLAVGLLLSTMDGRFLRMAGLGIAGQGALVLAQGLGVNLPS